MKTKIKHFFVDFYNWTLVNERKIIFLIIVHFLVSFALRLPYVNLFRLIISPLVYVVDWIVILFIFRPKKENILKAGLLLVLLIFPFSFFSFKPPLEALGETAYLLIATYIIQSISDLKK